jgi:peptide/nickel transport system ATP-binding protein
MEPILKIKDLVVEARNPAGKWFPIVKGVNIEAHPGEVVALIGESGAGKTTIALTSLAYCRPGTRIAGGGVYLGDTDITTLGAEQIRDIRGKKIAYVAQSAYAGFNPAITLGNQVAEGLLVHGIQTPDGGSGRVLELMRLLDLPYPESMMNRYPHQVSGGQLQRIMLAMAMVCDPDYLVLDEPTTALDVTTQIEVLKAVKDVIRKKGKGALYVSHDLSVVAQVADHIVVLYYGEVVEQGKTKDIIENPREEYTVKLMDAIRLVPEKIKKAAVDKNRNDDLLSIENIRASYFKKKWRRSIPEKRQTLRDVSFSVKAGKTVALVGESGSGKSTIARVIAGLLEPLEGNMIFNNEPLRPTVRQRPPDQSKQIQLVFQSPDLSLNPQKPVEDAVGRPLEHYYGLRGKKRRKQVEELLNMVELSADYADRHPSELSGGEKQRVSLARAFGAKPSIVLCDEVLSALDTVVGSAVLELMRSLQKKLGVAYLFISHDLATVATIADRVVVLYAGRVCEDGPTQKVFAPPYHPYTSLLISSVPELRCDWLDDILADRAIEKSDKATTTIVDCGCAFRNRCSSVIDGICDTASPPGRKVDGDHVIYCHLEPADLPKDA